MRKILLIIGGLTLLLLTAILIAPGLVPSSVYKDKIEAQLSKELGRTVTIGDDVKVASFPLIRAKTGNVSVQNYAGFESENFIKIKELEAKIRLIPLFSKRVEIAGFNLNQPEIFLERNSLAQMNWVNPEFAANTPKATSNSENTPYKRDGRYTAIDPEIAAFNLNKGRIVFTDKLKNQTYNVSEIEGFLSLPNLATPLKADISLKYQNEPVDINLNLDNLRDFLEGNETPLSAEIITEFANLDVKGKFLKSEKLDFTGEISSKVSDFNAVQALSPQTLPYIELLNSLDMTGNISFQDGIFSTESSIVDLKGDGLSAQYSGKAVLSNSPALTGKLKAEVKNPKALAKSLEPYLDVPIPQAALFGTTLLSAEFSSDGTNTSAQNVVLETTGELITATFKGKGAQNGDTLSLTGSFDTIIKEVEKFAASADLSTPYTKLVGQITAKGDLILNNRVVTVTKLDARTSQGDVNGTFLGNISYDTSPIVNGEFNVVIADFNKVNSALALTSPYAASVKQIKAKGNVTTNNKTFVLSDLSAATSEGLINTDFTGRAQYTLDNAEALSLSGNLSGNITDIRRLAALGGTELPANTDNYRIFETASVAGQINGTTKKLSLSDATVGFDAIKGKGNLDIALDRAKPFITSTINLEGLDLRPYMASYSAQNPTGEIQPWNETPFNVEAFKSVDGDFKLSTPNIITDRLSLGQSDITAGLRSGVLKAEMPDLSLYGGGGGGDLTFDTSKSTPVLSLNLALNELNGEGFLGAVAGFTKITGGAGTTLSIKASGKSQAAIMRSLDGKGNFGLSGGQIKGIDVVKFTTGLEEAFKAKSLPQGIGAGQITQFNALDGLFTINNGVVSINEFDVSASGVAAKGLGTIDLGNQTIDFKLRPRLTSETASGIGAFGIPLRFAGGVGSTSASLDTDFLGQIIADRAKAQVADRIREEVKGPLGNILGGVISGQTQSQPADSETGTNANGATETVPPKQSEEDVLKGVLGGLLGSRNEIEAEPTETPDATEKTETAKEDSDEKPSDLEKALGSLFGD